MALKLVGYLVRGRFVCVNCVVEENKTIPVYALNIRPYSQDCALCGEVVVKGGTPTILFDNHVVNER